MMKRLGTGNMSSGSSRMTGCGVKPTQLGASVSCITGFFCAGFTAAGAFFAAGFCGRTWTLAGFAGFSTGFLSAGLARNFSSKPSAGRSPSAQSGPPIGPRHTAPAADVDNKTNRAANARISKPLEIGNQIAAAVVIQCSAVIMAAIPIAQNGLAVLAENLENRRTGLAGPVQ